MSAVDDVITDLQQFYGKTLNESQASFWRSQLSQLNEDDLCAGVIAMKAKEPGNWLPPCNTIKRYAMEAMEARLNQEKAKAPVFSDIERSVRTNHGREALRLIIGFGKHKNRKDYIAKMRDMERRVPGIKWGKNADELESFWASEEKRHEAGKAFLEKIWRMQDAAGMQTSNNPQWYVDRLKADRQPGEDDDT